MCTKFSRVANVNLSQVINQKLKEFKCYVSYCGIAQFSGSDKYI